MILTRITVTDRKLILNFTPFFSLQICKFMSNYKGEKSVILIEHN